ncbi:dihydrofolate reductase family protein [Planotetraspora phitsanulokensis]|uniref:Deaminase reductase n=1 Tax=Planotetraspora phitsanulokensis TaxID=575192 RepID=A0A8J3U2E3_9ACTN|nr:dihydrofolate reductase family protein [Planotetraspora phitsanulokensis]GII35712.1 deaminase reductase [Planotetraspora phitsanulokensis]
MKLTVTTFMTLDGIAQGPGGPEEDRSGGFEHGGWLVPHVDEDFGRAMNDWFVPADAFLLGRKTYEVFAATWGKVTDEDNIVANKLSTCPKYVASRTLESADWAGTTVLRDDVAEAVAKLKAEPGRELQVHGSLTLIQTLIKADLVDEFRLLVFPVVLGTGKRLFGDIVPTGLKLIDSKATGTGVMLQTYQATGRPAFATVPPLE